MIGLVDGDIVAYELSFAAEAFWRHLHAERGEEVTCPPPFDIVQEMIDRRIPEILEEAGVEECEFAFTGKGNFRNFIAFTEKYKDRIAEKPYHYKNIYAVLKSMFVHHCRDGLEADDVIGILMNHYPGKYICVSRDKDLKAIPGWHYGWELGNQPSFGPKDVDVIGYVQLNHKRKIVGAGLSFFYAQLLMGDKTDSIPGIPGLGDVTAFRIISPCANALEMEEACAREYKKAYGLYWNTVMREQGRLLWMSRQVKNGYVKLWGLADDPVTWMNVLTGETVEE